MKHANIIKSIFAVIALFSAAGAWADTWTDPDTGYTAKVPNTCIKVSKNPKPNPMTYSP